MTTARPMRPTSRAAALAFAALLTLPGLASADGLAADADTLTVGPQSTIDLGQVAPSATMSLTVDFALSCANGSHVDPGQTVDLAYGGGFQPVGGEILSVSDGSVGPTPSDWPADGAFCPSPAPALAGTAASAVQLRAPVLAGSDYEFFITWSRTLSPAGSLDSSALKGGTTLRVIVDVVANTAPVLTTPGDLTVEGDTTGGWIAVFSATATDTEDDPDPTPTCSVAPGALVALGTTTVNCSVTDSGGMSDTGSFDATVVDTTAPTLTPSPDQAVTTGDPSGATLTYTLPAATDIVDRGPVVSCSPAPGSSLPLGATTVGCTATDASGNQAIDSFDVTVTFVDPRIASATWGEPVGDRTTSFTANRGRTLPIKVTLAIDGVARSTGDAQLIVTSCADSTMVTLPLAFSGGRWNAVLDTSILGGSCHTVAAAIDGLLAGSFHLHLRQAETSTARARGR